MAFYQIDRTDAVEFGEYDSLIVRAKGAKQALKLATSGLGDGRPFDGFKTDGSNARVQRLTDGRDHGNAVLLGSYAG